MEAMADHLMKMQLSLIHDEAAARAYLSDDDGSDADAESVKSLLDTVDELDDLEFVPHQNEMIRNMLDFALQATPFFLGRFWAVVKFPEAGLVLTDRPVVLYQKPENRSERLGVGVGNADEIWMPLDRRTALILHGDEIVGERVIKVPPKHSVDDFNQVVVAQAGSEVYCHPEDVWRLHRLDLPQPDRQPLVQVSGADWVKGDTDGVNAPPKRAGHMRYRRDDGTSAQ